MELSCITRELSELRDYYYEDTKSDDDIIYAVYDWVRNAHAVAQALLLEGRFHELKRCLDLCFYVLQEQHVEGDGRTVIRQAAGEDRILIDALLLRTSRLQQQYVEARKSTSGRDTEYYLKKLRANESNKAQEEGDTAGEKWSLIPPERGTFFGPRTQMTHLRSTPHVLPPLVTPSRPLFRTTAGGCGMSQYSTGVERGDGKRVEDDEEKEDVVRGEERDSDGRFSADILEMTLTPEARDTTLGENAELSSGAPSAPMWKSQSPKTQPGGSLTFSALWGRPGGGPRASPMRSLSVDCEYAMDRSLRATNVGTHIIKTAIAINSANGTRRRSKAVMQALNERVTRLLGGKISPMRMDADAAVERTGIKQESSSPVACNALTRGASFDNSVFSVPMLEKNAASSRGSSTATVSESRDALQSAEIGGGGGGGPLDVPEDTSDVMCWMDTLNPCMELSPAAMKQVNEVLESYQQKKADLDASMEMLRQKAQNQMGRFKPRGQVALLKKGTLHSMRCRRSDITCSGQQSLDVSPTSSSSMLVAGRYSFGGIVDTVGSCKSLDTITVSARTSIYWQKTMAIVPTANDLSSRNSGVPIPEGGVAVLNDGDLADQYAGEIPLVEAHLQDRAPVAVHATRAAEGGVAVRDAAETVASEPATKAELQFMMLRSSKHTAFPEVHQMVTRRIEQQVEREQRVARCCFSSLPLLPPHSSSSLVATTVKVAGGARLASSCRTARDESDCMRQWGSKKGMVLPLPSLSSPETTRTMLRRSLAMIQGSGGENGEMEPTTHLKFGVEEEEAEEEEKEGDRGEEPQPLLFTSLEELHNHPDWVRTDAVSLALCAPLHLAAVRIQCSRRRILAARERNRRAAAVEQHLTNIFTRDKSVVVIQQYMRGMLTRRQVVMVVLRLSYRQSQSMAHETPWKDTVSSDTATTTGLASLLTGHSLSLSVETWSEDPYSTGFQEGGRRGDKRHVSHAEHVNSSSRFHNKEICTASPIFCVEEPCGTARKGNGRKSFRSGRLRRIRENIACRVIVRAFRTFLRQALLRWEEETRGLVKFVTGRVNAGDVFHLPKLGMNGVSRTMKSESVVGNSLQVSNAQVCTPSVFSTLPEAAPGDVVAAWEVRMAEARRQGEFMTPLEHVKLSELYHILRNREHAEQSQLPEPQDSLLQTREKRWEEEEEEEGEERELRTRVDAVLLLQRCMRGYHLRRHLRVFHERAIAEEEISAPHQRNAEVSNDRAPGVVCLDAACPGTGNLTFALSTVGEQVCDEDHAIPVDVVDTIEQGIRRRNPLWFVRRATRLRNQIVAAAVVQSFLRQRASLVHVADTYLTLSAVVIQRNWRLVLKRRKLVKLTRAAHMWTVLRNTG